MTTRLHELDYQTNASSPLAGIRVLDLSRLVAGNAVSHALADFGAEVLKIEAPKRGDDLRNWRVQGISTYWKVYARNKKSVTLDFRTERGRELLLKLAETAHVLIENFVPGKLEELKLGPDVLHGRNPKLIILRVSGWGQTGPFKHKPGFGSLVEAMSGYASMNGFPDRPPALPPLALADMVSGLYGAYATMVALREIEMKKGEGQIIDLSLFEPILSILGPEAANYQLTGDVSPRLGSRSSTSSPRNVYVCSDGKYVALSASMQSMAERLFRVMGRADLITDPRFATNTDRLKNGEEIDGIVAAFMAQRTQAENLKLFDEVGVTVGPVSDMADLVQHPFVCEREALVELPDDEMSKLPMHNVIPRLSKTPGSIRTPAPKLGQHNDEVYASLGLDRDNQKKLRDDGVI
jgi:formyl-CoA transferase